MKLSERPTFAALLSGVCAVFRTEPTDPLLDAYWLVLRRLELDELRAAVARVLASARFMPAPADLLDAAKPSEAPAGPAAWEAVIGAIRRVGYTGSVDFGAHVNAVVRSLGGWARLCAADADELHRFVRRDFLEAFDAMAGVPADRLNGGAFGAGVPVRIQIGPSSPARKALT